LGSLLALTREGLLVLALELLTPAVELGAVDAEFSRDLGVGLLSLHHSHGFDLELFRVASAILLHQTPP